MGKMLTAVLSLALVFGQEQQSITFTLEELSRSALEALERNQLEKAESDLRQVLAISLPQLGVISDALENYRLAETAYQEANRNSPAPGLRALMGLGIVYLKTGRYHEGIACVEQILQLNLNNTEARHLLGKLYFMKGEFEPAANQLRIAYELDPDPRIGYTLALAYLRQRRLDDAHPVLDQVRKRLGNTAQLHLLIGRALRETGYLEQAISEFRHALEQNPQYPQTHYYLGLTYLKKEGATGFAQAREEFEAELKNNPTGYLPTFFLGVVLFESRDYEGAVHHLRRATELDSSNPDVYFYLGRCLFESGDIEGAIASLSRSIELTTDVSRNNFQVANTHFILGQALRKAKRPSEAITHVKRSEELKIQKTKSVTVPGNLAGRSVAPEGAEVRQIVEAAEPAIVLSIDAPDAETKSTLEGALPFYTRTAALAYQNLGRLESMRGNFSRAGDYLEHAADWDQSLPDIHFNLGIARLKARQPEKAAGALLDAWQRSPAKAEIPRLLAPLAVDLVDRRFFNEAWKITEALIKVHPEVADLHLLRGRIRGLRGEWDEARAEFKTALNINPGIGEAHYFMGRVHLRKGELDNAEEEFDNELKANPKHAQAMYYKAFALILKKRADAAIPWLEEVIRLDPGYAGSYYQMGRVLLEKNQIALAVVNLETAAKLNPQAYYIQYHLARAYGKSDRRDDAARAHSRYAELKMRHYESRDLRGLTTPSALEELHYAAEEN
jgi:tetratricopeptide (TPR) repeat protein